MMVSSLSFRHRRSSKRLLRRLLADVQRPRIEEWTGCWRPQRPRQQRTRDRRRRRRPVGGGGAGLRRGDDEAIDAELPLRAQEPRRRRLQSLDRRKFFSEAQKVLSNFETLRLDFRLQGQEHVQKYEIAGIRDINLDSVMN